MSIWSCRCSALGPEGSLETSSRPSELQRRTIGVRTCCDDVVARPADADWLTVGADDWKRQTYAHSSPPSTGEHDSGSTDKNCLCLDFCCCVASLWLCSVFSKLIYLGCCYDTIITFVWWSWCWYYDTRTVASNRTKRKQLVAQCSVPVRTAETKRK